MKKCLVYKNGVYAYYLGIKSPLITLNFMKPVLEPDHLHQPRQHSTIAKKGYVLGTFLDIEGAFDNVSFKAISEAIDLSTIDLSTHPPQAGSKTWSPTDMSP